MRQILALFSLLTISFTVSGQTLKLDSSPTLNDGYYVYKNPTLNGKGFLAFDYNESYYKNDKGLLRRANRLCVALGHSEAKMELEHLHVMNGRGNESSNQFLYVIQDGQPVEVFATWKSGDDISVGNWINTFVTGSNTIYYSGRFVGLKCK